jgi:glycosyltransferase involved in cell wall biosynthesis
MLNQLKPGRILLVLQSADPPTSVGGMEALCVDLAREFIRRGMHVAVVIPETPVFEPLAERFLGTGAEVLRLNTDARRGRAAQIRRWWQLVRFMRKWSPDVVHLHTGGATGGLALVATARFASGATVAITEHDVPDEHSTGRNRIVRHALDGLAHCTIAVSRRNAWLRRERMGALPDKFAAIVNGIALGDVSAGIRAVNQRRVRLQLGIDPNVVLLGSLVRLAPGKGLDDLMRAFALVRQDYPCELLLVGDGPLRSELEALAADLGVRAAVHFAGHQRVPQPFLDAMDVFALGVPAGSMSIALLEAMARGLPPVITFCGPEEAVIPDETGLCAAPRDPVSLAAALGRLAGSADLRLKLGAAGAQHARRHFSINRVADDLLEVYAPRGRGSLPPRLRADGPPNPRPGTSDCAGCLQALAQRTPIASGS